MSSARILVAGAGALGSTFGAFLRRAGHPVTLLGRPSHLEAIRSSGLAIDGVIGEAFAIARGRRTEIDAIDGYVCRRGTALGIATPRNAVLAGLVHAIESARAFRSH